MDCLVGGFPCPVVSQAARGRNVAENLWPEFARLIRELRPRYVVVENVEGLLSRGRGFGRVLGDLAESGFDATWRVLEAAAFGAPHRRARLWLVAYPHRAMRVLVCGDRNWDDSRIIGMVLRGLHYCRPRAGLDDSFVVINGRARGADFHASQWALTSRMFGDKSVEEMPFLADWDTHGKAAGPIRNQQMLTEGKPDLVLAFHDNLAESKGTADMVRRARKAGLPVYVIARVQ